MSTQYHSLKKRKDYDHEDLPISLDYGEIDNGYCCCRDSLLLLLIAFLSIVLFWVFSVSGNYYWNQGLLLQYYYNQLFLLKLTEVDFFKDIPYSCYWTPIFSIFFRYFLKQKQLFRIVETYLSISFPG